MAAGVSVGSGGGRRGGLPQTAAMMNLLTDMAFNLLIFFVVLADPSSETGRPQQVPAATKENATESQAQRIEVALGDPDRTGEKVTLNKTSMTVDDLSEKLKALLAGKVKPEDRVVVVESTKDTPYGWWVAVTGRIERAGGVVALQLEEERVETVK